MPGDMLRRVLVVCISILMLPLAVVAVGEVPGAIDNLAGQAASQLQAPDLQAPGSNGVAAKLAPTRLVIPSIRLDAKVEARGLDSNRNLATARDFNDVAWYSLGPQPGEPGNAIINGHVDWWTGDAVFTHLARVRVGDRVEVVRNDGVAMWFKITGKRTVGADDRVASLFAPSPDATLTLITCAGVWNPFTQSDTQRLLVSAILA
jgi:LPXTG-site transpeptidase (sortase) family protein